jgi:hypothetical protein
MAHARHIPETVQAKTTDRLGTSSPLKQEKKRATGAEVYNDLKNRGRMGKQSLRRASFRGWGNGTVATEPKGATRGPAMVLLPVIYGACGTGRHQHP